MVNSNPQQTYSQYKLRKIGKTIKGDVFGITIPREVAEKFEDVKFQIEVLENSIVLKSGLDISEFRKKINQYNIENYA